MSEENNNNADAIIKSTIALSRKPHEVKVNPEEPPIVLVPEGFQVRDLTELVDDWTKSRDRPKGFRELHDLDSFIWYVKRHASRSSPVFVDGTNTQRPRMTAVFNAHWPLETNAETDVDAIPDAPELFAPGDFGAIYDFQTSDEWNAWTNASNGQLLGAKAFAEFLEDRIVDVMDPATVKKETQEIATLQGIALATPAKLQTLSRGVEIAVDQKVKAQQNLDTGETVVHFEETHGAAGDSSGAPLKLPNGFCIAIPVVRGGPSYAILVRLRHRVRDQRLGWVIKMQRTEKVLQLVLDEAAARVAAEAVVPVFSGKP